MSVNLLPLKDWLAEDINTSIAATTSQDSLLVWEPKILASNLKLSVHILSAHCGVWLGKDFSGLDKQQLNPTTPCWVANYS